MYPNHLGGEEMSLIIGLVDRDGLVHAMSDAMTTNLARDNEILRFPKIALKKAEGGEQYIVGAVGMLLLAQVCTHGTDLIELPARDVDPEDLYHWCVAKVRPALWKHLRDQEMLDKDKSGSAEIPGCAVLFLRGSLFAFSGIGEVHAFELPYMAVGAGSDVALGALGHMFQGRTDRPKATECKSMLASAFRIVCARKSTVGPPFTYMNLNGRSSVIRA